MQVYTIGGINLLPDKEKREIYSRAIPEALIRHFNIPSLHDEEGSEYFILNDKPGSTDVEFYLYHQPGFRDPVLYGHLTDTIHGQIHILLYILNDPESPRFDVDKLENGSSTRFGTIDRNIPAEVNALSAGLAPGQIRKGLGMLSEAISTFENFVVSLGQTVFFAEPLYYHNAILFEKYGFAYQQGKKMMEQIEAGFQTSGIYQAKLKDDSLFRKPESSKSVRLRSWAIHDGILNEQFTNVTMYKLVGKNAGISTSVNCPW